MGDGSEEPTEAVSDFVYAARQGDLDDVREALSMGVEVNAPSYGRATAILMASANGHLDAVRVLLEARAATSLPNEAGNCPLHWAALNGHVDICRMLVEARADANARNEFKRKPFDEAFSRNLTEVCELIAPFTSFADDAPAECPGEEEEVEIADDGSFDYSEQEASSHPGSSGTPLLSW
eukprot:CAMPEP_0179069540 /NCGR_PEP_ID=MMETSP0796-20121207/30560_1 /TAXON_ID=73915 /ORGANISM="Pyrodinium bahamense, Strain pbaha01" /LENGTH=179 /DNA_ID=CAMNT_0020766609 /DNA_START=51 /DNA_END=588 /DNA_ORIENTATION=-